MQDDVLHIDIIDPTGWGTGAFNAVYMQMKEAKGRPVRAIVNEYGGNALEGIGIHNLFRGHDARVEAHIPAFAISAHTIVSSGADHVTMPENGYFMIHNPWSVAIGEADDMEHSAELLKSMKSQIVNIYHRKTKLGKKRISEMMDQETWLTPQEALSMGFIDAITEGVELQNSVRPEQLAQFRNVPQSLLNQYQTKKTPQMTFADQILNTLKGWFNMKHDASAEEVKAEMEKHGTIEAMKASIRAEVETELKAQHDTVVEALKSNHLEAIEGLKAAHRDELDELEAEKLRAEAALESAQARITELEKEPATPHTRGKSGEEGGIAPSDRYKGTFTEKVAKELKKGKKLPF